MTLTINLTPQAEAWLNTEAQQRGLSLNDFVLRVIEERMPIAAEPEAAPQLTEKNKAVIALMDEWLAKAPTDPEEIRQAQAEVDELMESLSRNWIEAGKSISSHELAYPARFLSAWARTWTPPPSPTKSATRTRPTSAGRTSGTSAAPRCAILSGCEQKQMLACDQECRRVEHTYDARDDWQRDAITKATGYQTLRFQSKQKPTVAELADLFAKLLPTLQPAAAHTAPRSR